jgi:hypothetical protein
MENIHPKVNIFFNKKNMLKYIYMSYTPSYDFSYNLYVSGYQNAAAVANPITCTPSGDYYCSDDEEENCRTYSSYQPASYPISAPPPPSLDYTPPPPQKEDGGVHYHYHIHNEQKKPYCKKSYKPPCYPTPINMAYHHGQSTQRYGYIPYPPKCVKNSKYCKYPKKTNYFLGYKQPCPKIVVYNNWWKKNEGYTKTKDDCCYIKPKYSCESKDYNQYAQCAYKKSKYNNYKFPKPPPPPPSYKCKSYSYYPDKKCEYPSEKCDYTPKKCDYTPKKCDYTPKKCDYPPPEKYDNAYWKSQNYPNYVDNTPPYPPSYPPSYPPPSYAPPSYAPPSYAPPSYAPPSYAPPSYAPPSYDSSKTEYNIGYAAATDASYNTSYDASYDASHVYYTGPFGTNYPTNYSNSYPNYPTNYSNSYPNYPTNSYPTGYLQYKTYYKPNVDNYTPPYPSYRVVDEHKFYNS